jgi:cytoskeleton protein RodZ
VTDALYTQPPDASDAPKPLTAGATLRSAREAAGLSLDDVAQQLKLAPRQVQALEEDDFQRLPGRTFARGFARNYARFIQLDPDAVLALMPAAESAPALERPSFAAARRPMGEIPVERAAKRSGAPRALMLLLVLVIVGAAAYYQYSHQASDAQREATAAGAGTARPTPGTLATPSSRATGGSTTALPNPVSESAPAPVGNTAAASEATPAAPATGASAAPATAATTSAAAARASDASLVLVFKGTSWAEVKDASGRVILQMTGGAGMTQTVSGAPPLELSLGNAPDVAVTFRGQTLDLAPYTRGVVARVALK